MADHAIVSQEEWLAARTAHLIKEKELTRARDAVAEDRRKLPWVKLEKNYVFDGPGGKVSFADLFDGSSQLLVYHFMLGKDWEAGCKSCSFWADQYNSFIVHLRARDANMVSISRGPVDKLEAFKKRMGWNFTWVSSAENSFNKDFAVSLDPEDLAVPGNNYNFRTQRWEMDELPGLSTFYKDDNGVIYHHYSTYSRGLDMLNGAYHHMDVLPKGRDENSKGMAWLKLKDEYQGRSSFL